jgi:hypothetical protein
VWNRRKKSCLAITLIIAGLLLSLPSPTIADGGPIVSGPELWAQLEEGQQTAVVTLNDNDTADVDLFVSLLDSSGQSHEVVFFIPLGTAPTDFSVTEKTSLAFDEELTKKLDEALREGAQSRSNIRLSLLSATLLTNGGWILFLCFPWQLTRAGGGGAPPEQTYETESSRVDIYGLDEDTDLEALINTTGLDPSVQETLSRLRGQRIAIVTLQTQPPLPSDGSPYPATGQPGIHLSWTTALVAQSAGAAYSYPLGTGSSWARPIGLTRVYVVSPPGIDFTVQYPRLGTDYSGYSGSPEMPLFLSYLFPFLSLYSPLEPQITDHYDTSAYAVDETGGDFGHIWRVTYTQSNSAEDVIISLSSSGGFITTVRRLLSGRRILPTVLLGLLIALMLWVVAWRYCMPRMLGMEYHWRDSKLWRDSLTYLGINAAGMLAAAAIADVIFSLVVITGMAGFMAGLIVAALIALAAVLGVPSILLFLRRHQRSLDIPKGRMVAAYIVVILVANSTYLALTFGCAALLGVI